jgi:S1-C subfamily serine protease
MKWGVGLPIVGIALAVGGCSKTVGVYGIVGSEANVFTGTSTGYSDHTGTIELQNAEGVKCIGNFVATSARSGSGSLTCSDGQRAMIQYNIITLTTGYGFGVSNSGMPVKFYYGLSREEGAKYIGLLPDARASTPRDGRPAPPRSGGGSTGTGFYITRQGHVLTAAHVVDKCATLTVSHPGSSPATATIVATDPQNDLAVLMAPPSPSIAAFRTGRAVRPGESVVAYGFPLTGTLSSGGTVTSGTVNALSGLRDDTRYLQISAPVQPGNSGGPLLDSTGAVIGLVRSQIDAVRVARSTGSVPQNVNFATKVEVMKTFLDTRSIATEAAGSGRELSAPDIGERARAFSILIECKR